MPRDTGLAQVHDYRDLEVIAVNMPNEAGIAGNDWNQYLTTVDAIEAASGYDLLALLPDKVEAAVESNTQPPFAVVSGSTTALDEGGSATFDGSLSVDPNGSIVSYAWNFGDGSTGSGASAVHTFSQDGVYQVSLTVTDNDGLTDTANVTVTVANVSPVVDPILDADLKAGDAYSVDGTFTDPGADNWTATVDFGDGSAPEQAMLSGHDFSLVHVYSTVGTFTVTLTIADDDSSVSTTHTVTVTAPDVTPSSALEEVQKLVDSGKLSRGLGRVLTAEILAAQDFINRGKINAAKTLLRAIVAQVDFLVRVHVLSAADAAPLRSALEQMLQPLCSSNHVSARFAYGHGHGHGHGFGHGHEHERGRGR